MTDSPDLREDAVTWSAQMAVTVRESELKGRLAEVLELMRASVLALCSDPTKEFLSVWGSAYAPVGQWRRRWAGKWTPLTSLYDDRIGGDASWSATFTAGPEGDVYAAAVRFREAQPGWLDLLLDVSWTGDSEAEPAGVSDLMESLTIKLVERLRPVFGRVEPITLSATELENNLHRPLAVALEEGERVLRGYAWITYLPPGVVEVLGGVCALLAHEEFYRVSKAGDGVVIRVTERQHQYDHAAWRAVFDVVRPAMPEGEVVRAFPGDDPHALIYDDELA